ncbi:MFS transporter [Leucobacter allii]|uniref:MFS transporter n=1 Tax=Leucobacter allii TaxID=2932247 RepID=UPI001FD43757|nr:MFS transporter [Leucobacter allii]UOR01244.1 MFS transporter [Leucobacter allii]
MHTATSAPPTTARTSLVRVVASSTVGAVLEWFDFFIFASLSGLILGRLFFEPGDPVSEVLLGFSTLAVGYFARPVGGIIFGHFGDRIGRKRMLVVTVWLMGGSTVLLGLLPTFAVLGGWATAMLVLLRLVQGIAVGGEFAGAATLIIEHAAETRHRAFLSTIANVGASFGFLLSSALLAILLGTLTPAQFEAWGWRIPFLISAVLLIVGAYIRTKIADTPAFLQMQAARRAEPAQRERLPIAELFAQHGRAVFCGIAICLSLVYYQLSLVFVTPYATTHLGLNASMVLWSITIAQVLYIVVSLSWAAISDRFGRKPVLAIGFIGCLLWLPVYFTLLTPSSGLGTIVLAVGGQLLFVGATYGPLSAYLAELFPAKVRYTGMSIGFQGASAFAGLTPLISFALLSATDTWLSVLWLGVAASVIGITGVMLSRETAHGALQN